jgi:hypothetical protein
VLRFYENEETDKGSGEKKMARAENITKMGPTRVFCITRGKSASFGALFADCVSSA